MQYICNMQYCVKVKAKNHNLRLLAAGSWSWSWRSGLLRKSRFGSHTGYRYYLGCSVAYFIACYNAI